MLKSLISAMILAQIFQIAPPSMPGQASLPTVRVSGMASREDASYVANLRALPQDASTYLIRAIPRATTLLGRISDLPHAWPGITLQEVPQSVLPCEEKREEIRN